MNASIFPRQEPQSLDPIAAAIGLHHCPLIFTREQDPLMLQQRTGLGNFRGGGLPVYPADPKSGEKYDAVVVVLVCNYLGNFWPHIEVHVTRSYNYTYLYLSWWFHARKIVNLDR